MGNSNKLTAQVPPTSQQESYIFSLYNEQLKELFASRAMPPAEFKKRLEKNPYSFTSFNDYAQVLKHLYPVDKGVCFLLYFFNNDTLTRVFIEPGIVKELKRIKISKGEIQILSTDIYNSLNLYQLIENRAPKQRGISFPKSSISSTSRSYSDAITKASSVLFPNSFSKKYQHLVILPTLNIGTIPFYLLKPYADSSCLIDRCSFTIASGLIGLVTFRTKVLKNTNQGTVGHYNFDSIAFNLEHPLFISNPTFPSNTSFVFPDLPGAKKEIESILPFAANYILLEGANATKSNVIKQLRNCDVAYFATHGVANEFRMMDSSFLVLSGDSNPFLTAQDIADMRDSNFVGNLRFPEMVVLSACQTGLGKSMEAGIAGLARSFLVAGANQVIMSLWSVDDEATAYLMNRFIYHLQQPHLFVPSEPLRLAAIDTKKKYPEPSKWASFSVFGVDY